MLPLLFVSGACAQNVSFLPHKDVPVGPGCCLVAAGDFDGDGKTDLVVSYGGDGNRLVLNTKLALLRGDGKGGFQSPVILATFDQGIFRVLASDLNRDGKLDLLVKDMSHTYVLLGKGDGTFGAPSVTGVDVHPLLIADFNRDGKPDLLAGDQGAAIYLGKGDGTFGPPSPSVSPQEGDLADNIAAADLNGDEKLDVAWTSSRTSSEEVWVALGNGDGTLQPFYRVHGTTEGGFGGHPLAIADFNHDGKPDLVVGARRSNVAVSLGKGDGTFQEPAAMFIYEGPNFYESLFFGGGVWQHGNDVFVADFNGDGNPDIIVDNALLLGKGDGTFKPPLFFAVGVPQATLVFAGDLNGDGKPDLVLINAGGGSPNGTALSVLLNNNPGFSNSVLGYSATTGSSLLAPASIGSIYGTNLAKTTASATGTTPPTQLGGISLRVRDNMDTVRLAPLYYVSPGQINFVIPADTPTGLVTLTVDDGSTPLQESANATVVNDISPGFFAVNGVPLATALRVVSSGTVEPAPVFACTGAGQCAPTPIDLGRGSVYLSLYGTGFRATSTSGQGRGSPPTCQAGGLNATVQFVGAQPTIPGLDQINIVLPPSLPHGPATIQCRFAGQINYFFAASDDGLWPANPVQVAIQ